MPRLPANLSESLDEVSLLWLSLPRRSMRDSVKWKSPTLLLWVSFFWKSRRTIRTLSAFPSRIADRTCDVPARHGRDFSPAEARSKSPSRPLGRDPAHGGSILECCDHWGDRTRYYSTTGTRSIVRPRVGRMAGSRAGLVPRPHTPGRYLCGTALGPIVRDSRV